MATVSAQRGRAASTEGLDTNYTNADEFFARDYTAG